jgi:hypothetical protein
VLTGRWSQSGKVTQEARYGMRWEEDDSISLMFFISSSPLLHETLQRTINTSENNTYSYQDWFYRTSSFI